MGANIKVRFRRKKFMVNHAKKNINPNARLEKITLVQALQKMFKGNGHINSRGK